MNANHAEIRSAGGAQPHDPIRFVEHADRDLIHNEVHARPPLAIFPPLTVSHMAFKCGEHRFDDDFNHLCALMDGEGLKRPEAGARHAVFHLGDALIKWERHTEFLALTIIQPLGDCEIGSVGALTALPKDWLEAIDGPLMAGMHIVFLGDQDDRDLYNWQELLFGRRRLFGARVDGDNARVWTDFDLHADRFGRILIQSGQHRGFRAGRLLKWLLEIETYRVLAMMGLPKVGGARPRVSELERSLRALIDELNDTGSTASDQELLHRLTELAAGLEEQWAALRYRIAASRAYYAIVRRRLGRLAETPLDDLQTLTGFVDHRLAPAMDTIDAVEKRLMALGEAVERTTGMIRTRVDIALEEQNQHILRSMDERGKQQLLLNQAVENFSVAAISYYVAMLFNTAVKGAVPAQIVAPYTLTAIALPFIVLGVWWGVRRTRKGIERLKG